MTRTTLKKILAGIFLAAFVVFLACFNFNKPRILVLHSFRSDSTWTRLVNSGIQIALKQNRNPVSVKYHYTGIAANQSAKRNENAIKAAHRAIARHNPDIIIAVDDEVNDHVVREYAGKGRPKIVFTGILQPPEVYGYAGAGNVSGVMEQLPLNAVSEAILSVHKGKPSRIAVIGMDDDTGRAEMTQVKSFSWAPHRLVASYRGNSFAEWQKFTMQIADSADVLLVLSYDGLARGNGVKGEMPLNQIAGWLEKNAKPFPICICVSYSQDGGGLQIAPSSVGLGQQTMQMALKWIESRNDTPPPIVSSSSFRVGIQESVLAVRGITMPPIYTESARIADTYQRMILSLP